MHLGTASPAAAIRSHESHAATAVVRRPASDHQQSRAGPLRGVAGWAIRLSAAARPIPPLPTSVTGNPCTCVCLLLWTAVLLLSFASTRSVPLVWGNPLLPRRIRCRGVGVPRYRHVASAERRYSVPRPLTSRGLRRPDVTGLTFCCCSLPCSSKHHVRFHLL